MLSLLEKRGTLDQVYEQEQVLGVIDELKLQLLKLLGLYESLTLLDVSILAF